MPGTGKLIAAARHRRLPVTLAVVAALLVAAGIWLAAGQPAGPHHRRVMTAIPLSARTDFLPGSAGRCAWPLRVHGRPFRGQVYLARCYLRALAHRDAAVLHELSWFVRQNNFRSRITRREMTHAADARSGIAAVTFRQNQVDAAQTAVTITFADGARESLQLTDMSLVLPDPAPALGNAWRLQIGSDVKHLH
ncbi:MAG TPA: hypothetical protein VF843_03365 [Streptosporangiaceae bacterium]